MVWVRNLFRRLLPRLPIRRSGRKGKVLSPQKLRKLERLIGYSIKDPDIFVQALVHRSALQHMDEHARSNERLEFLGDSVLNFTVAEYLYLRFPNAEEGELTKVRSRLVNKKALAAYARAIRLREFILMSPSAAQALGKGYDALAADTFEALIAGIYLDGGMEAARRFIHRSLHDALHKGLVATADENYKSMLLEYAQSHGLGVPRYTIAKEEGPDHDRTFTVEVIVSNVVRGAGSGKNKKEAEQSAASKALARLASTRNPGPL